MIYMKKFISSIMAIFLILILPASTVQASFLGLGHKSKSKSEPKKKTEQSTQISTPEVPKVKIKTNKPSSWQPEIMVGLFKAEGTVKVITNLSATIKGVKNISKDEVLNISISGGKLQINGNVTESRELEIRPRVDTELKNMRTSINGKTYFGGVKIILRNGRLVVINIVTVEEYLRGVLPKEMSPSWNEEALKSQAVAARTFSLKNRKRHQSEGYDLCSSSHCQVYGDVDSCDERTDEAINKTFGEVLFYKGKLIEAFFHTDSGGMTENVVDVWGTDYPYLRAATEIETKTQSWSVRFSIGEFSNRLAANKLNVGTVQFIKVTNLEIGKLTNDRSTSGRVKELTVIGDKGEAKVSGTTLRSIFELKSTLFDVAISGDEVILNGYGWGHGIGMSQMGAKTFAEHGYNYEKILAHYYKDTILKRLY